MLVAYRNKLCDILIAGRVLLNISNMSFKFLQLPNQMNKGTGYGLEVPFTYTCTGLEKVVVWIQRKISEEMKTTKKINA